MARIVIDEYGTKLYYNDAGKWHRDDGPAIIYQDGTKRWHVNGSLWRINGPSVMENTGNMMWKENIFTINIERACVDRPNGLKLWNTGISKWPLI